MSTPFICHVEYAAPDPIVLEKFLGNYSIGNFSPSPQTT